MNLFKIFGTIAVNTSGAMQGLSNTADAAQQTESKMSKAFSKIGTAAVACGKVIATGLAVGTAAFGALTVKAMGLAGELEQNLGGAEAVFGGFASKMEEHANKAFSSMGLSASDYLATANKMGSLFKGAGFEAGEAADLTATAMQRAADVASIMGIDVSVAMESVAGAAKGNFTMMDNLGVAMNDTNLQAYALSKGIAKSTSEMTSQEKIGLAMTMFLDKTADYAGNYAKENETLAGSLTTAKAALSNFLSGVGDAAEVGEALTKTGKVISSKLLGLLPSLVSGLTVLVSSLIPEIPPLIQSMLPAVLDGAIALIQGVVSSAGALINVVMGIVPSLIDAAVKLMSALGSALIDNIDFVLDSALSIVLLLGEALVNNIPRLANAAASIVEKLGEWISENAEFIIESGANLIVKLTETIVTELPKLIKAVAKALAKAIPALISSFDGLFDSLSGGGMIVGGLVVAFKGMSIITKVASFVRGLTTSVKLLNVAMSANPLFIGGLAVAAFGALLTATIDTANATHELSGEFEEAKDSIEGTRDAIRDLHEAYAEDSYKIEEETERTRDLWEELQTLTDETGYVDDANKDRANYILGELNEALGTEYTMNGNIIGQYQQMQEEIDNLIQKRRAESLFERYEGDYLAAMEDYGSRKDDLAAAEKERAAYYASRENSKKELEQYLKLIERTYGSSVFDGIDADMLDADYETTMAEFMDALNEAQDQIGRDGAVTSDMISKGRAIAGTLNETYRAKVDDADTGERVDAGEYYDKKYAEAQSNYIDAERTMQRYSDAELAIANGRYEEASDLLLDGVAAFWSALRNGQDVTESEREALLKDLRSDEAALNAYREGLENGDSLLNWDKYNSMMADFVEKLALFGDGYDYANIDNAHTISLSRTATTYDDRELLNEFEPVLTSDEIGIKPISFAEEEKSTMAEIKSTLATLTGTVESLLSGGLIVKVNNREFGRMVRTVKA